MHTEDLVVHDCGRREAVEHIRERFPKLNTEPALAFVVEAVDPVDARTLMIPPAGEGKHVRLISTPQPRNARAKTHLMQKKFSGYLILYAKTQTATSMDCLPLST